MAAHRVGTPARKPLLEEADLQRAADQLLAVVIHRVSGSAELEDRDEAAERADDAVCDHDGDRRHEDARAQPHIGVEVLELDVVLELEISLSEKRPD